MVSRREWIGLTLGAGAALSIDPRLLHGLSRGQIIERAIPSTGEKIPVVGLGSSATFSSVARSDSVLHLSGRMLGRRAPRRKGQFTQSPRPGSGRAPRVEFCGSSR